MGWDVTVSGYGQINSYGVAGGIGTIGFTGQSYIDGNAVATAGGSTSVTYTWSGEVVRSSEWYMGVSTPPSSPLAASIQHGMTTGSTLATLGGGISGVVEVGLTVEMTYTEEPYSGLVGSGLGMQSPGSATPRFGYYGRDGDEMNALDQLSYNDHEMQSDARYGDDSHGNYVDRYPERTSSGPHSFPDPNNGLGPSASEPSRPGSIDHTSAHVTDTTDPGYIGYIGPASGQTVTSRTDVVMTRSEEVREILGAGLNAISDIDPLAVLITAATPWTLLSFSSKNHNTYDAPITANASSAYPPSTYYENGVLATWHDLNGNGVVDQLQIINTVTNANGGAVEALVNMAIAA